MKPPSQTRALTFDRIGQRAQAVVAQAAQMTTAQMALAICGFGVIITLGYRPFSQPVVGDTAFYDYIAQSILRGQLPYRDTIDIKFPGAAYLSALAMAAGHVVGLRDVLAVRALYVLLTGFFSALIFLVAANYLRSRAAGVMAALIPLALPRFGGWVTGGTEPKLPLMICGLLSLWLIAKNRPFWAGFCSMLACLFWQPGLMFTGTAVLICSKYLTSWRDLKAAKVMIGAALPLAVVLLYFYHRGALGDLWAWTITYNYSVFGPDAQRSLFEALLHLWTVAARIFQYYIVLVPLSLFGFAWFALNRLKAKRRLRAALASADLYRDALIWPLLVYFAFSLVNFQAGPDLLPFVPFIAIFAGNFLVKAGRWLRAHDFTSGRKPGIQWQTAIPGLVIVIFLLAALFSSLIYRLPGWAMRRQDELFKPVADQLGAGDKIYVHGTTELLVLLNRANLSPLLFLDQGADEFAAQRRGVPFSELIGEMDAQAPKVVALSRLKVVRHRDEFQRWVEASYTPLEVPGYDGIYLRKP